LRYDRGRQSPGALLDPLSSNRYLLRRFDLTLTLIAVANAVLWSGVIIGLLLYLMRQNRGLDEQVTRLESELGEGTEDAKP
jgi:hypothetical protein